MFLFAEHWPFWLGAAALALVALAFLFATGSPLGVSSSYARLVAWRSTREREASERDMPDDPESIEALLVAATREEFGSVIEEESESAAVPTRAPQRTPLSAHLVFLVALGLGGLAAAVAASSFRVRWDASADFVSVFGGGWTAASVLVLGGVLVGFGTAMAGGCTSGHGLSGCSRLQPPSLIATAAFFGTGIVVSLLLSLL